MKDVPHQNPPGLGDGRRVRNLDRRDPNPLLDAAREASPGLWQRSAPPRPADDFDRAIAAVARPGLFDPNASREKLKAFIDKGREEPSAPGRRQSKREQLVERFRTAYPEPEDRDRFRWSAAFAALPDDQQRRVEAALNELDEESQIGLEVEIEYAEQLEEDDVPAAQILSELGYDVGGYDDGYDRGWA